jgi:hypothetical protein
MSDDLWPASFEVHFLIAWLMRNQEGSNFVKVIGSDDALTGSMLFHSYEHQLVNKATKINLQRHSTLTQKIADYMESALDLFDYKF